VSVVLPVCPAEWAERVDADHTPFEEEHASGACLDLNHYRAEATQRVRDLFQGRQLQLRMRHDGLEGFMQEGYFRNRFDGGSTRGTRNKEIRLKVESIVLGVDRNTIASERPIYGYLQGTSEDHNEINLYGSVILTLSDALIDHATIVLGDSVGSTSEGEHPMFAPQPLKDPSLLCTCGGEIDMRTVEDLQGAVDPRFPYAELHIYGGLLPRHITFVTFCENKAPDQATLASLERAEIRYAVVEGYPS
jgi:hypothetical protein